MTDYCNSFVRHEPAVNVHGHFSGLDLEIRIGKCGDAVMFVSFVCGSADFSMFLSSSQLKAICTLLGRVPEIAAQESFDEPLCVLISDKT